MASMPHRFGKREVFFRVDINELVAILELHRTAPIPDLRGIMPGVPEGLAIAVARAMAKAPEERWPDAASMAAAMG